MKQNIWNIWKAGAVILILLIACLPEPRSYLLLGQCILLLVELPKCAYHLSYEVEIHAAETYAKYLALNGHDDKILEILNDELHHSKELNDAMELIL